jgi:predicted RNA-binding Zn-ribbon protein involved in translation (DUF1610 family)
MTARCADSDEYAFGWNEYRRLRRNVLLVWLGYVPVVGCFAMVCQWLFHSFVPAFIGAGAYMLWFLLVTAQYGQFSCPRCGESFAVKGMLRLGPLARKCMHCGLRKWQCTND